MEFGIVSFAERTTEPRSRRRPSAAERLHDVLEEVEVAEQVGLDVYGLGEHHRDEWAVASPAVVLAAAAARTTRIRLTSAVTVLSAADPVRVFEDFTALDLVSGGRAEIIAGRGAFVEPFALYRRSLSDYEELFDENLRLLLELNRNKRVTWQGRHRPRLEDQAVEPRPLMGRLPVSVGVGGSPASADRAGLLGVPMTLASTTGDLHRLVPLAERWRVAWRNAGHERPPEGLAVSAHGFVADDREDAVARTWPARAVAMRELLGVPVHARSSAAQYAAELGPTGAVVAGSPDDVVAKIALLDELLGLDRFLLQISVGTLPHEEVLRAIERFGTEVVPRLRGASPSRSTRSGVPA